MDKWGNILRSTRIERTLIPISFILLTCSIANQINLEIFSLILICTLIYITGGILNAKVDNDFKLKKILIPSSILILIAIILSLQNKILIITTLAWIALSFLYNKKSRKILFADSIILSITHSLLPILSTAFILGIFHKTFPIAVFVFLSMNLIIPMKNLNGIQEDLKRKYKTLPTKFQNGRTITIFLFNLYSILIILSLFLFNLNPNILILFSIIFLFHLLVNYLLKTKQDYLAYTIARFIVILFNLTIILSISTNKIILLGISLIAITYSAYLIKEVKNKWNTMM